MPSPVAHAIAGVAAGWLVSGAPRRVESRWTGWSEAALFGVLGALPDVDLLFGAHSGPTHSIGAAAIVGALAWVAQAAAGPDGRISASVRPIQIALACLAAYGSHVLLDWLARDTTPPIGIMALWPFNRHYYESDLHIFLAI
jgi:membrane-bound metal-dependent hydrolase YbcI (DUF457 family)